MRIAIIITDNREPSRTYSSTLPYFAAGAASFFEGLALLPELKVHIITCAQKLIPVSPEKLADNIWFHSLHVPKIGWLSTCYQGCARAVRRKLKQLQPDIVQGWGTERECAICAVVSGFPNVVTIQGNMAELARMVRARICSFHWLAARLEDWTLPRTNGVLCNSGYTEDLARPRSKKTWRVAHAMRQSFLEPAPDADDRPCVVLNAGVVSPRKRQLELLDVAESLHRKGLKFEMRFIGFVHSYTDPYVVRFLNRIRPMEAAGFARFLGPQPEKELVSVYDSVAGVVHFPTEEAFGNVVGEALARNLKFFGARLGGIVDIAQAVPGAEMFAKDDWQGLTVAMADWIKHGHPRPTESAPLMRLRYSPEVIARRHVEIYREVLSTFR